MADSVRAVGREHLPPEEEAPIRLVGEGSVVLTAYVGSGDSKKDNDMRTRNFSTGTGFAIGLAVGSALTIATGEAVWLPIGIAIGAALGAQRRDEGEGTSTDAPEGDTE